MRREMIVTFSGGSRVSAEYKGFKIETDQPVYAGGEGKAPAPFDLFLASIGTCAGFYVFAFCQQRKIPPEDASVVLKTQRNDETKMIEKITLEIHLPQGFPDKYIKAVVRAVDICAVKEHIIHAPSFEIKTISS